MVQFLAPETDIMVEQNYIAAGHQQLMDKVQTIHREGSGGEEEVVNINVCFSGISE